MMRKARVPHVGCRLANTARFYFVLEVSAHSYLFIS